MVETYRSTPLDMEKVFKNLTEGIKSYATENHIKVLVLGLSGGIDSTVVAALCKASGIPLIGISLPCSTNMDDENNAAKAAGMEFCDTFKVVNLQEPYEVMEKFCAEASGKEKTPISQGNIKARLRMITLYDIASKVGGIVMGTSNKTEWLTGFWTLHGDVGDFNPIGELWKTEVYTLAKWMKENVFKDSKALEQSIALIPTDGNGVKAGGDAEQIMPGYTYNEIDHVLSKWDNLSEKIKPMYVADGLTESIKNTVFDIEDEDVKQCRIVAYKKSNQKFEPTLGDLYGVDSVRKVIMRSWNSEFKRRNLELCINLNDGNILLH
jgi:nicotinamide-nucleotide amidase